MSAPDHAPLLVDRRRAKGIRLAAHKAQSTAEPILNAPVPSELVLSLRQQSGDLAIPVVKPGQIVAAGEPLAEPGTSRSAAIHAPYTGTIVGFVESVAAAPTLEPTTCIVLRPSGQENQQRQDAARSHSEPWRWAGIVGLGGAIYPTTDKLTGEIRTLVINGAECEPFISCDDMLMREMAPEILSGAEIIASRLTLDRCVVAVETDKEQAISALTAAAEDHTRIEIAQVPTVYPAGGERQLLEVLFGAEVPANGIPQDIGYLCHNVGTALAIHEFHTFGKPVTHRIVTVTGGSVTKPRNIRAPIGMRIRELIDLCGGYKGTPKRLIMGGSMMGLALPTDEIPITKATNAIVVLDETEIPPDGPELPCIRCGECAAVCPATLQPQELLRAERAGQLDRLIDMHLNACIECGCCDVACPSHIPLTETFRLGKHKLAALRDRDRRSERAAQRATERDARLAREAEREEQQRERILDPLSDDASARAALAAARERARKARQ